MTVRPGASATYGSYNLSLASDGILYDGTDPATTLSEETSMIKTTAPSAKSKSQSVRDFEQFSIFLAIGLAVELNFYIGMA